MGALPVVNRLLALLLSALLVVGAVLLGTEAVRAAAGEPSWLVPWREARDALAGLRVGDPAVLSASAALVVLGLALLVLELRPRRPGALRAEPLAEGVETVTTRSGLRGAAESAARGVSGVRAARARVVRGRLDVVVGTRARGEARAGLEEDVTRAVESAVRDLGTVRPLRVRTRVEEER